MGYHIYVDQERPKFIRDLNRLANDRSRLQHALEVTLKKLGMGETQVKTIVTDVRKADFSSIERAMMIKRSN